MRQCRCARSASGYWRTAWPFWAGGLSLIALYFSAICWFIDSHLVLVVYWLAPMSRHWFLVVPVVFLFLGIAGLLGRGVGIQHLFRNRPTVCDRHTGSRNSYAVWTAFGATLLIFEMWAVIIISEGWKEVPDTFRSEFDLGEARDSAQRAGRIYTLRNSLGVLFALLLAAIPILIVLGVLGAVPARAVNARSRTRWDMVRDMFLYLLGILLGVFALIVVAVFISVPNGWVAYAAYLLAVPFLIRLPHKPLVLIVVAVIWCGWTALRFSDSRTGLLAQDIAPYGLLVLFCFTLVRRWKSVESLVLAATFGLFACLQYSPARSGSSRIRAKKSARRSGSTSVSRRSPSSGAGGCPCWCRHSA